MKISKLPQHVYYFIFILYILPVGSGSFGWVYQVQEKSSGGIIFYSDLIHTS